MTAAVLVERHLDAVAQPAHVVGEPDRRDVEVEEAHVGVAAVAEAVHDVRRDVDELARADDDVSSSTSITVSSPSSTWKMSVCSWWTWRSAPARPGP